MLFDAFVDDAPDSGAEVHWNVHEIDVTSSQGKSKYISFENIPTVYHFRLHQTESTIVVSLDAEERREYTMLETTAQEFYKKILMNKRDVGKCYLTLFQKLSPMRIACSGGRIPLGESKEQEANAGDQNTNPLPNTKEKVQSKFAYTSKLKLLIAELKKAREADAGGKNT